MTTRSRHGLTKVYLIFATTSLFACGSLQGREEIKHGEATNPPQAKTSDQRPERRDAAKQSEKDDHKTSTTQETDQQLPKDSGKESILDQPKDLPAAETPKFQAECDEEEPNTLGYALACLLREAPQIPQWFASSSQVSEQSKQIVPTIKQRLEHAIQLKTTLTTDPHGPTSTQICSDLAGTKALIAGLVLSASREGVSLQASKLGHQKTYVQLLDDAWRLVPCDAEVAPGH